MDETRYLYAGTVDHVLERMAELWETGSPEYFVHWSDRGLLPFDEVKRNLQLFGERIMPEFPASLRASDDGIPGAAGSGAAAARR
jgi:hypothetical protein